MGREERLEDEVLRIFFVLLSVVSWFFILQWAAELLGWPSRPAGWSYLAAFYGASAAYLVGRTKGRLRKVVYDSPFAAYINLLIILVPLFLIYLALANPPLEEAPGKISRLTASSPLTLASGWLFSFTAYRFLDKLYDRIFGVFEKTGPRVSFKTSGPIQRDAEEVAGRLEVEAGKLAAKASAWEKHAHRLYDKALAAQVSGKADKASAYLTAYWEAKKNSDLLVKVQVQLEGLVERLKTLHSFAETMAEMPSAFKTISELKGRLKGVIPAFSGELEKIGRTVEELLAKTQAHGGSLPEQLQGKEAQKILLEAGGVAEARLRHGKD
ncbi:hypothetical protein [Candidatus Hecatella orcuttiae]|jgi:division protein CdvB (Snf7/Vps24/ESCRT-III family)|uniref:hypothetical protein n=1 Tax=Candidatus Hecatella orcuttiae TaxID=1935119 RepID=UPI002867B042|nr:hypothetical protein [Candidatus Hecatella orcuttiae]